MSILIPSTEPGVLEDIGSLLTYNPAVEAYEDCERAMEHDGEAWREVWPSKIYLYKYGDRCIRVTGGWTDFRQRILAGVTIPIAYFDTDCIKYVGTDDVHGNGYVATFTNFKVDVSKYKKLCLEAELEHTYRVGSSVIGLASQNAACGPDDTLIGQVASKSDYEFAPTSTYNIIELDISDIVGEYYVFDKGYGWPNTARHKSIWLE